MFNKHFHLRKVMEPENITQIDCAISVSGVAQQCDPTLGATTQLMKQQEGKASSLTREGSATR